MENGSSSLENERLEKKAKSSEANIVVNETDQHTSL